MTTRSRRDTRRAVLFYGSLWGILESTAGALLHLLPLHIGFLVWMPVAAACMLSVRHCTGKSSAVLLTAALCATIKLTNLLLPVRVDRVVHPALSILWEGLSFSVILYMVGDFPSGITGRAGFILGWNTLWRCMNLLTLRLEPRWMRELSLLASADSVRRHLLTDNLLSCAAVFAISYILFRPRTARKPSPAAFPQRLSPLTLTLMCALSLVLQWAL